MGDSNFPETIAKICIDKLNSLPRSGKPTMNQWTVLSCIIQEMDNVFDVVALGTGSKCIGRNKMSPKGDILNDSHAEVVCRRGFMNYLYKQMDSRLLNETSIFTFETEMKKFHLKDEVRYHFFTTMMPCGDASIFPKCDLENTGDVLVESKGFRGRSKKRSADAEEGDYKKFKSSSGDIHRTGAKCLENDEKQDPKAEGVGFHVTGVVRTKPGRGDPTLSVSCSDKITKWCYLGLQGNLLSVFLEKPVYLSTFTVTSGTPYSQESLRRSFFERIGNIDLAPPFSKNSLQFYQAKDVIFNHQKNDDREVCPSSICWFKDKIDRKPEVAVDGKKQGVTKKNMNLASARLAICKVELLKSFKLLHCRIHFKIDDLNYSQCKEKASEYQTNWKILKSCLGVWPVKPDTLFKFY